MLAGLVAPDDDDDGHERHDPIPELGPPSERPLQPLVDLLEAHVQPDGLDAHDLAVLVAAITVYLMLPRQLVRSRVIPMIMGPGADSVVRTIMRLLLGAPAELSPVPDRGGLRDLAAELAESAVVGIHDPDQGGPPWLPSILRAVSSGTRRRQRRLYSDRAVVDLDLDCVVITASMGCPVPGSMAHLRRTAPIPIAGIRTDLPDGALEHGVLALRPHVWADALAVARGMGRVEVSGGAWGDRVLLAIMIAMGEPEVGARVVAAMEQARHELVLVDDPVVDAVEGMVPRGGDTWFGTSTDALRLWRSADAAKERDVMWDGWTPTKVGIRLRDLGPSLQAARGISVEPVDRAARSRGWVVRRGPR